MQVTEILPGGAAWDSGFVDIGDVLLRVDGKDDLARPLFFTLGLDDEVR